MFDWSPLFPCLANPLLLSHLFLYPLQSFSILLLLCLLFILFCILFCNLFRLHTCGSGKGSIELLFDWFFLFPCLVNPLSLSHLFLHPLQSFCILLLLSFVYTFLHSLLLFHPISFTVFFYSLTLVSFVHIFLHSLLQFI